MMNGTNGNPQMQPASPAAGAVVQSLETMMSPEVAAVLAPAPSGGQVSSHDPMTAPIPAFADPSPFRPRAVALPQTERFGATNPAMRKFGALLKAIPGAEKVRLRKRFDSGHIGLIGDYALRDVMSTGDIDAFVLQYAVPQHRGGKYIASIFDAKGQEFEAGEVFAPDPIAPPPSPYGGENTIALRLIDQVSSLERKMMQPPAPPPDPFETIRKMRAMQEEFKQQGLGGDAAMVAMMMAQQKPAGPDPYMIEQMATMRAQLEAMKAAASTPPMPMPPMAPTPNPMMDALASAVPALMAAIVTKLTTTPAPDPNALGAKDVIALMTQRPQTDPVQMFQQSMLFFKEMTGGQKEESLADKLKEMTMLKELATDIAGGGGAQGTTFWDALGALFSNKSFGDNLGAMIGSEIKAKQAQMRQLPSNAPNAPNQNTTPNQTAQPPAEQQKQVQIPDNMRDLCAAMEGADTDEARAQAVVSALMAIAPHPQWSNFVRSLVNEVANGNKQKSLQALGGWMRFLVGNKLLDEQAALRCLKTFETQWDVIHKSVATMTGKTPELPPAPAAAAVPTPQPVQTPASNPAPIPAPVAPASSSASASADEEEGEEEEEADGGEE